MGQAGSQGWMEAGWEEGVHAGGAGLGAGPSCSSEGRCRMPEGRVAERAERSGAAQRASAQRAGKLGGASAPRGGHQGAAWALEGLSA